MLFRSDSVDPAPSDQENVESLKSSVDSLRRTAGDSKGPGAVAARRLADALQKLADSNQATRDKAQDVFVAPMKIVFDQLRNTLQAQTVTLQNLPQELVESWKTKDGLMRVEVEPKGDPNDNDNLRRFADAVLADEHRQRVDGHEEPANGTIIRDLDVGRAHHLLSIGRCLRIPSPCQGQSIQSRDAVWIGDAAKASRP